MNLKINEQGGVELNGEPIADWYKKRDLIPCIMRYAQSSPLARCCLAGAMGFSAVENRMNFVQYELMLYDDKVFNQIHEIGNLIGEDWCDIAEIEQGYMFGSTNTPYAKLGAAARQELLSKFFVL